MSYQPDNLTEKSRVDICVAIYEKSPIAFLVANDEGRLVDINPAGERLFGLKKVEIVGRPISYFAAPVRQKETKKLWSEFQREGQQGGEFIVSRENGTDRRIRYVAVTNFMPGLHLSIARDITESGL